MQVLKNCKTHGKTLFCKNHKGKLKCLKCMENDLDEPLYRIINENGKNYLCGKEITKDSYLNQFLWLLTDKNKKTISTLMNDRIRDCPGIYGIFFKKSNGKVGECLYIGQSVDVERRINEHKSKIISAESDLKYHKRSSNLSKMYYNLAFVGYENLKFVQLIELTNDIWSGMNAFEAEECLALFEQYCMDCFDPRYNVSAARKSSFNKE